MIELQYKQATHRVRKSSFGLGGFELEAPFTYDFPISGKVLVGKLSKQFKLTIPRDGLCRIPDTQHNRDTLRNKFEKKYTGKSNSKGQLEYEKQYIFDVLSNIDLNEAAPHAGGGTISQTAERDLKDRIAELEAANAELVAKTRKKKTSKKTGGETKTDAPKGNENPGGNDLPDLV